MSIRRILKLIREFSGKHWRKWTILAILAMVTYIGFIFYQYIYKPIYKSQETSIQRIEIKQELYQKLMDSYLQSENNINKIINKDYPDPFR
ncbi:MAG: hypothetical protein ACOZAL_00125 [Patescibacteria group bacterium]